MLGIGASGKATLFKQYRKMVRDKAGESKEKDDTRYAETVTVLQELLPEFIIKCLASNSTFLEEEYHEALNDEIFLKNFKIVLAGPVDVDLRPLPPKPFSEETKVTMEELLEAMIAIKDWLPWRMLWDRHWGSFWLESEMIDYIERLDTPLMRQVFVDNDGSGLTFDDYLRVRVRTTGCIIGRSSRPPIVRAELDVLMILAYWARVEAGMDVQLSWRELASLVEMYSGTEFYYELQEKENDLWELVLLGSQRSERLKWIYHYDNVSGIMWVASLTAYASVPYEDNTINSLDEELQLLARTAGDAALKESKFVLVLTKKDVMRSLIAKGKGLHCAFEVGSRALADSGWDGPQFDAHWSRTGCGFGRRTEQQWLDYCLRRSALHIEHLLASLCHFERVYLVNALDTPAIESNLFNHELFFHLDRGHAAALV